MRYRLIYNVIICYTYFFDYFQFFASDERIKAVRKIIMVVTLEQRKAALDLLMPYQRSDFEGIFRAIHGNFTPHF
jgi:hypothetical protein